MALLGLVYRDQLFPREPIARPSRRCAPGLPARAACRIMVGLAGPRARAGLRGRTRRACSTRTSTPAGCRTCQSLRARFSPRRRRRARVTVIAAPLSAYDALATVHQGERRHDRDRPHRRRPPRPWRSTICGCPPSSTIWPDFAARADKEGWPAARFLAALAEHEIAERARRRIERHLAEARLPPGKTLDSFDFEAVPMISKAQVMALAAGDSWLEKGANLLAVRPARRRQVAILAAALGLALVENGWRVLFTRTTDLVQRLQVARRDLQLEAAIAKLDKYHLLILDDLAYVTKDQAETSVLFELIAARYERRSLLITANQPFGDWGKIFPDPSVSRCLSP